MFIALVRTGRVAFPGPSLASELAATYSNAGLRRLFLAPCRLLSTASASTHPQSAKADLAFCRREFTRQARLRRPALHRIRTHAHTQSAKADFAF